VEWKLDSILPDDTIVSPPPKSRHTVKKGAVLSSASPWIEIIVVGEEQARAINVWRSLGEQPTKNAPPGQSDDGRGAKCIEYVVN
jgi:hypothetical protein